MSYCISPLSGDGSGAGGSWADRTTSLPSGGSGGTFAHQLGYDLVLKVKPDNSDIVFIGGVNVFRSTDGFASTSNTTWISGFAAGVGGVYPGTHADQHAFVFFPGNPASMLSGNDCGVYRTSDDLAATVVWNPLNIGYVTTQFYTVAIDHGTPENDIVIGGTQDNGTWFTNSSDSSHYWTAILGGDGAYCAIADGRSSYYTSIQNGVTYRRVLDNDGNLLLWTRIDPTGGAGYLFISPFALDPNNINMMYLVGGTSLWRNSNLTGIPLFSGASTSVGWTHLTNSTIGSGVITALGVSAIPADRVYYGTSVGTLFRLDSANLGDPLPAEVTGGSFPAGAYVSWVAIDPSDADRAIVVFSNYSVKSLFYTSDAGASWADVSGNLEEFPDGTGNGPSCRWATITPSGGYFVATSTGVYSTAELNGASTLWALEGSTTIGNVVVDMLDARTSDGRIVAATHGAGVYSAYAVTAPPSVPILVSPFDAVMNQPLLLKLRWNRVVGALTYHLQVSLDGAFGTTTVDDSTVADTSRVVQGLEPDTIYYWRVNAKNILGESGWSGVWSFRTADTSSLFLVRNGWNMISVPFAVPDDRTTILFPDATSNAFAYEGGYAVKDSLLHGIGYWLKFGAPETLSAAGGYLAADTIEVNEGWNLIGSISAPIAASAIGSELPGIITSQFFGYSGTYVTADSICPGNGYWVKVSQSGSLILSMALGASATTIRIKRIAELPPSPPDGRLQANTADGTHHGYALEQNYPNPFNPSATIRFQLPVPGYVTLKIYDVLGREVKTLMEHEWRDNGTHEVVVNAGELPSGAYLYRLTGNDGTFDEMKRMLIIK